MPLFTLVKLLCRVSCYRVSYNRVNNYSVNCYSVNCYRVAVSLNFVVTTARCERNHCCYSSEKNYLLHFCLFCKN